MTIVETSEARRPPRNLPGTSGTLQARIVRSLRLFADLQVASVSRDAKAWLAQRRGSVLEVGCGDQPYRSYVPTTCSYSAIDRGDISSDFEMVTGAGVVTYCGDTFPFPDARFDALFHTEVIEHVFQTSHFLEECRRVLKPGGDMFFTVPFQARYHFIPHDFFRFTPASLHLLLSEAGFQDIVVTPRGNDITVAGYKIAAVGFRWATGGLMSKALFLCTAPITTAALVVAHAAFLLALGSTDDCLGYSVTARAAPKASVSDARS